MIETNIASARAYYRAFNEKDVPAIASRLHPEIHLIMPTGEVRGREAVVEAVSRFLQIVNCITIREKYGSGDQLMLVYDLYYGEPAGTSRTAVLMHFRDRLIDRIELFYDPEPFARFSILETYRLKTASHMARTAVNSLP